MNNLLRAILRILVVHLADELQTLAITKVGSSIKSVIEKRKNLHKSLLVFDMRPVLAYLFLDVFLSQSHQILLGHGMAVGVALVPVEVSYHLLFKVLHVLRVVLVPLEFEGAGSQLFNGMEDVLIQ